MDTENTIEVKLAKAQELLDEFEEIHNLNKVKIPTETEEILTLSHERLSKLDPTQCAEYSFQLAQYSYYIQRIYNKEMANLKWLNNQLAFITANKLNDYDKYTKHEVKLMLIARENEVVMRILRLVSFTEQKIERMNFIGAAISNMSAQMKNLSNTKSYQWRGQ